MIAYNKIELEKAAKQAGFVRDTFEKVLRLKEVLKYINSDAYLREHLALKGGTAINMTIFNLPRLSVDIDLDFTPNLSKDDTQMHRKQITEQLCEYMEESGYYRSESSRYSHSLDAFLFLYQNAGGNRDNIKVEINYSLRSHLFEPTKRRIVTDMFQEDVMIRTLHPMEIFAAKANALMSRAAARDLYDFNNMITYGLFGKEEEILLRKCIIFYASVSAEVINRNFDTSAIDGLNFTKIRRDLFPVLRKKDNFNLEERKKKAKTYIQELMMLTPEEREYLEAFERKEYRPELLFDDKIILDNICSHPMAIWKMKEQKVKEHNHADRH